MNASLYFQQFLHALGEWAVSFGVAFWMSSGWRQEPPPFVVRLVKHPQRFWLAIAFGIAPPILGALLWPLLLRLYQTYGLSAQMPISYLLSAVYGVLLGLAASCCAAPAGAEEPFRPARAAGVSAALIIAFYLFGSFVYTPLLHAGVEIVLAIVILVVARACLGGSAAPLAASTIAAARGSTTVALLIGFLPSALLLAAIGVATTAQLSRQESNTLLVICSVVSVVCCFGASIVLFTRKTGGAIAGGIVLLLMNAFIAFFFGCCAALNS
ncbi:MAG: hypothetical protein WDN28_02025 [Chthoniobacter sp.]